MRRVPFIVACVLILNCGGAQQPATPAPAHNLPLQPGRQVLTLVGLGVSENPLYQPCVPRGGHTMARASTNG